MLEPEKIVFSLQDGLCGTCHGRRRQAAPFFLDFTAKKVIKGLLRERVVDGAARPHLPQLPGCTCHTDPPYAARSSGDRIWLSSYEEMSSYHGISSHDVMPSHDDMPSQGDMSSHDGMSSHDDMSEYDDMSEHDDVTSHDDMS